MLLHTILSLSMPKLKCAGKNVSLHHSRLLNRLMATRPRNLRDDENIIDAEIVGEPKWSEKPNTTLQRKAKAPAESNFLVKAVDSVAKFFGLDNESKLKKERQRKVNESIDNMLAGTGIVGGVFGGLMKGVANVMAESFAESAGDMDKVMAEVQRNLESQEDFQNILGDSLSLGSPFSTSISSSNINGIINKNMNLIMPVTSSGGNGNVQVQASIDQSGRVSINSLVLKHESGRVISSSNNYRQGGRGKIIDV